MIGHHGVPETYWAIEDKLMAGFYPGSTDPEEARKKIGHLARRHGIRCFVDLTVEGEVTHYGVLKSYQSVLDACERAFDADVKLTYHRHPVPDLGVPPRREMSRILDTLDAALDAREPAYVHCLGGRGRTGTVVACYFVRHAERYLDTLDSALAPDRALRKVVSLRRKHEVYLPEDSPQTRVQFALVRSWNIGE